MLDLVVPHCAIGTRSFGADAYNSYLQDLVHRGLSPEDRAALQRWAFRAYNACETGDLVAREKRALKLMGATKSTEKTAIY